jgi:hypothetical protein
MNRVLCPCCRALLDLDWHSEEYRVKCGVCKQIFLPRDAVGWDESEPDVAKPLTDMVSDGTANIIQNHEPDDPRYSRRRLVPGTDGLVVASLILGLFGLVGWCVPVFGLLISLAGVVLGVLGLRSSRQKIVAAAVVGLNVLGLGLALWTTISQVRF